MTPESGEKREGEKLTVGNYTITWFNADSYWMEHESGEGFQVNKAAFEEAIGRFYKENF